MINVVLAGAGAFGKHLVGREPTPTRVLACCHVLHQSETRLRRR